MIFKILFVLLGGFLSRLCGRKSVIPFGLEQWLYALPYLLIFASSLWGIPAYIAAVMGKRTGHGQYLALGRGERQSFELDERLDFIVRFFFGVDRGGSYWRCVTGMAVTGLAVTIVPGILYAMIINPLSGTLIALSGASKAFAYMAGWFLYDKNIVHRPTVLGEVLTGVFGWGLLAVEMT